jgi:hypothetical protein
VVVYAAFHYPAWAAAAAWLGCSLVSAMPLLYAPGAIEHLVRELFILLPAYAIVGTLVFAGREVLTGLSRRATALGEEQARLAAEQSSLRRVATAVAAGSPPQAIFALVSSEAGRLLDADAAAIGRYLGADRLQAAGVWQGRAEPGQVFTLDPDEELSRLRAAGEPLRIDRYDEDDPSRVRQFGYRAFVGAPVHAGAGSGAC